MFVGVFSNCFIILIFFFTDANNDYSIYLYQTKSCELQVAVFSVSLCQPIYAEVGIIYVSEIESQKILNTYNVFSILCRSISDT